MTIQIVTNIDLGDGLEISQGKAQVKVDGQTVALTPNKQLESRIVVDRQAAITGGFEFTVDGNTMVADKVGRIKGTEWYVLGAARKPVGPSDMDTTPPDNPPGTGTPERLELFEWAPAGYTIRVNTTELAKLYGGQIPPTVEIWGYDDDGKHVVVAYLDNGTTYRSGDHDGGYTSKNEYCSYKGVNYIKGFYDQTAKQVPRAPE